MPTLRTEIAGIAVAELARRFGTPTFVYDAAVILRRLADLAPFDVVRYAQKAASNLAILDLLRRHGALVDAVSAGEIERAMAAGYAPQGNPPPIVYTADVFDAAALDLCVERQVHVNCGSPDMIDQLGARAPGREITLRINPGFGHGHSRKTNTGGCHSKHGIWHEHLADAPGARASATSSRWSGCTCTSAPAPTWSISPRSAQPWKRRPLGVGSGVHAVSAGGGLPIPYRPDESYVDLDAYFALWNATRKRLEERFGHPVRLEIEPGRYLVAESGFLVARDPRRQAPGRPRVLPRRRGVQQSRPADPLRRLSPHGDRTRRRLHPPARAGGDRRRAAV